MILVIMDVKNSQPETLNDFKKVNAAKKSSSMLKSEEFALTARLVTIKSNIDFISSNGLA